MAIVSYRLYCRDCDEQIVVRDDEIESSDWKVHSLSFNDGLCPKCDDAVVLDEVEWEPEPEELELEALDHIGAKAAQNLREAGYDTDEAICDASDEELLEIAWVGEKALFSLKEATKQLEPQQRWDE